MSTTQMYEAMIVPAVGGMPITVTVPASGPQQATKLIEHMYGPVKNWYQHPMEVRTK